MSLFHSRESVKKENVYNEQNHMKIKLPWDAKMNAKQKKKTQEREKEKTHNN